MKLHMMLLNIVFQMYNHVKNYKIIKKINNNYLDYMVKSINNVVKFVKVNYSHIKMKFIVYNKILVN